VAECSHLIVSVISGAGGGWLIEALWRPSDRKRAARILLREVALNRAELARLSGEVDSAAATQAVAQMGYSLSRVGLSSVGLALSELPPEVAGDVIGAYDVFNELDEVFSFYQRSASEYGNLPEMGYARGVELISAVRSAGDRFRGLLASGVTWCDKAINGLAPLAHDAEWKKWIAERMPLKQP
jgi:hypothetical protein